MMQIIGVFDPRGSRQISASSHFTEGMQSRLVAHGNNLLLHEDYYHPLYTMTGVAPASKAISSLFPVLSLL